MNARVDRSSPDQKSGVREWGNAPAGGPRISLPSLYTLKPSAAAPAAADPAITNII